MGSSIWGMNGLSKWLQFHYKKYLKQYVGKHEKVYYWDRILYIAENTNIYGCTLKKDL